MNERQEEEIIKHGNDLKKIFKLEIDSLELCKKVRRIEVHLIRPIEQYCNGDITEKELNEEIVLAENKLNIILKFRSQKIPIFINTDPRGYALKIEDKYIREHNIQIHRDMGGFGIVCPDFSEVK